MNVWRKGLDLGTHARTAPISDEDLNANNE